MAVFLVWFRQDLRLQDNLAWFHACEAAKQHNGTVIPLFINDNTPTSTSQLGAASRVWLHHSLAALNAQLNMNSSQLILRQGAALSVLETLINETQATHLYWNRVYEPHCLARDTHLKQTLGSRLTVKSFNAALLKEPWEVLKADQTPYKVFTAYWKAALKQGIQQLPLPAPAHCCAPKHFPASLTLNDLQLLPTKNWHLDMMSHWQVGETTAFEKLNNFLEDAGAAYKTARDFPAQPATSQLSPHLHFGEISPRQAVYYAEHYLAANPNAESGVRHFLQELGWREFAYYLLYHFPHTVDQPLNPRFDNFPWSQHYTERLQRWQRGQTGYPIIDAGMRQLWQTGWMHNRIRMLVASFLTKNLLIPWQQGENWFRDTLVDADLANNVLGWQWTAGSGADAAPYFRIFNPVTQSQKFDPEGHYIRQWLPELRERSTKNIHLPRQLGDKETDYPLPIIDLQHSREHALDVFKQLPKQS